jgi:hypothetical protein
MIAAAALAAVAVPVLAQETTTYTTAHWFSRARFRVISAKLSSIRRRSTPGKTTRRSKGVSRSR